jgi:thiamine biosynthesis lipoprotein ApbE
VQESIVEVVSLLILLTSLAATNAAGDAPHSVDSIVDRRLGSMGTWLSLRVTAADRATALAASERAVRAIESAEARLSTWRDDSELSRLNAAPAGRPFSLSPELAAI